LLRDFVGDGNNHTCYVNVDEVNASFVKIEAGLIHENLST